MVQRQRQSNRKRDHGWAWNCRGWRKAAAGTRHKHRLRTRVGVNWREDNGLVRLPGNMEGRGSESGGARQIDGNRFAGVTLDRWSTHGVCRWQNLWCSDHCSRCGRPRSWMASPSLAKASGNRWATKGLHGRGGWLQGITISIRLMEDLQVTCSLLEGNGRAGSLAMEVPNIRNY